MVFIAHKGQKRVPTWQPTAAELAESASRPSMYGGGGGGGGGGDKGKGREEPALQKGGSSLKRTLAIADRIETYNKLKENYKRIYKKGYNTAQKRATARLIRLEDEIKELEPKVENCEKDKAILHRFKQRAAAEKRVIAKKSDQAWVPELSQRQLKILKVEPAIKKRPRPTPPPAPPASPTKKKKRKKKFFFRVFFIF